jgi:hypothetical protein
MLSSRRIRPAAMITTMAENSATIGMMMAHRMMAILEAL